MNAELRGCREIILEAVRQCWQAVGYATPSFLLTRVNINGFWSSHSIHFRTMEQTNVESGQIRKVRWTGESLSIEDAPREKNETCEAIQKG